MNRSTSSLLLLSSLVLCALIGCGDDGGDPPATVDAGADGGDGLVGLGQLCGSNQEVCPQEAPRCLLREGGGTVGFCSQLCVTDGTFETDAEAEVQNVTPPLSSGDDTCASLYSGQVGTTSCGATLDVEPELPLEPNTSYTFNAGCVIECGTDDACPGELTCDGDLGYCVSP